MVLYLGRLAEKKGLDRLVDAFKNVLGVRSDARLVIAGEGDPPSFRGTVERWVQAKGVSQSTTFTGLLSGANKLAALADADVFVLPSSSENFAVAMFEAMASRLPVVISSGVQLSGDIARCGAGVVADDAGEIGDAICRILSDVDLRCALGELGFAFASQFGWDRTAAALATLYSEILHSKPLPKRFAPSDGQQASAAPYC
jgi:glycosyltransferase involved in cell wall biosynthesis